MNERLTSEAATTYAKSGELFMASENTNKENQPWDPVDTPLNDKRSDKDLTPFEKLRQEAYKNFEREWGRKPESDIERSLLDKGAALLFAQMSGGESPSTANNKRSKAESEQVATTAAKEVVRAVKEQLDDDEEDGEETTATPNEKSQKKEGKKTYPEDSGPEIDANMTEEQVQSTLDSWRTRMLANIKREMQSPETKNEKWIDQMNERFRLLRDRSPESGDITKLGPVEDEYFNLRSDILAEKDAVKFLVDQGIPEHQQTREQLEWAKDQMQEATTTNARIDRIRDQIRRAKDIEQASSLFERLRSYVREIADSETAGTLKLTKATHDTIQQILNLKAEDLDTLEKIRAHADSILSEATGAFSIKKFFVEAGAGKRQRRGGRIQVRSLEELVELVAESQGGDFQPGGKFEIMNERGEIQLQNLMAWIRERILAAHDADPDSAINTFNRIAVPTFFRSISLDEMLFTPTYFQKRKRVISGSEGESNLTMVEESVFDKQYEGLKYSMLYEAWLFGISHTNNAEYRQVRGQEEPLFNKIAQLYSANHFTKDRNRFLNIFNLSKIDKEEFDKVGNKEMQGSVGKAIQRATLAYYHMWELVAENEKKRDKHGNVVKDKNGKTVYDTSQGDFTTIEGNNFYSALGADGTKYFYHAMIDSLLAASEVKVPHSRLTGEVENFSTHIEATAKKLGREKDEEHLTYLELIFKKDRATFDMYMDKLGIDPEVAAKYDSTKPLDLRNLSDKVLNKVWGFKHENLNIFDGVDKEQRLIKLVNKSISAAAGRKEDLNDQDTEYAGEWAFTMRDWTGIAARNDTQGIGFDAWSKLINFQDYRGRQGRGRSGAGNMYNFPGFKRLGVTLLEGLLVREDGEERKDDKKKSLITVLEESNRNNTRLKTFDFDGEAMKQFSANHINNAFKVFQFILEKMETKMSSVVSIDKSGRPVFNHEAALQIMDGLWHDLRYAFDQPRFNYDLTEIEGWENRVVYDEKGKPVFDDQGVMVTERVKVTQRMREHMFGEELIDLGHKVSHRPIVYGKDGDKWARQMGRSAFAYLVAKEIFAHRQFDSGYVKWPVEQIELIQAFFHHQALEFGQKGEHNTDMKIFAEFFDHHEWNEILKLAKSSYRRMYTEEYGIQGVSLIGGMIGKTIGETIKQVSTVAK